MEWGQHRLNNMDEKFGKGIFKGKSEYYVFSNGKRILDIQQK